jgi:hypothetical protein
MAVAARAPMRATPSGGFVVPLGPVLRWLRPACRLLSVVLLGFVLSAGLFGDPHPAKNLAPTFVWIAWWVGLSLVVACLGNVWPAFDPWRAVFDTVDALARRATRGRGIARGWAYPRALGVWPAAILLLGFTWIEIVSPQAPVPSRIAGFGLAWSVLTLLGMLCFGRAAWQENADVFAVHFTTLGRFAPIGPGPDGRTLVVRPPGRGLVEPVAVPPGMVAFVIAMLATVLFDGVLGTQVWRLVDRTVSGEFPRLLDREGYLLGTAGLLAVWLLFLGAYLLACRVTAWFVRGSTVVGTARLFVLSLVPIAIAYNVAHNSAYVLGQGQAVIPLLSDPLGRGWNLFGMATYSPDLTLVGARFTWYVAVGAIVAGHVIAVWLAHRLTLRAFGARRAAVVASVPLTILMVVYTALSLSVIAEPLVRFRTPDPSYSRLGPAGQTIGQAVAAGALE